MKQQLSHIDDLALRELMDESKLLLKSANEHFDHELDEFVMVNPLIAICVNLVCNPLPNELRQIQVMLRSFNG